MSDHRQTYLRYRKSITFQGFDHNLLPVTKTRKMIKDPAPIAEALRPILANTVLLYLKTHQYHHNVKGVNFYASHLTFNDQYSALVEAVDTIGERIRKLEGYVPTTSEVLDLGNIEDSDPESEEFDIYRDLATDNIAIANQCIEATAIAMKLNDNATVNLLGDRQEQHEDFAWRLADMLPFDEVDNFRRSLREGSKSTDKRLRIKA